MYISYRILEFILLTLIHNLLLNFQNLLHRILSFDISARVLISLYLKKFRLCFLNQLN
jgi:hypothetical protein